MLGGVDGPAKTAPCKLRSYRALTAHLGPGGLPSTGRYLAFRSWPR